MRRERGKETEDNCFGGEKSLRRAAGGFCREGQTRAGWTVLSEDMTEAQKLIARTSKQEQKAAPVLYYNYCVTDVFVL